MSRTRNLDVWITSQGAIYDYYTVVGSEGQRTGQAIRMSFDGSKNSRVMPEGLALPGGAAYRTNTGNTPGTAHRYGAVVQKDIYSGIDARYYVDGSKPRYDLIVAPNADPSTVRVRFDGASAVKVRGNEVVLGTTLGALKNGHPVAYQANGKGKTLVAAKYFQRPDGSIGIKLGGYDKSRTLVIDPLVYGSYYGGESGNDEVRNVVSDSDGVFLVGRTLAPDFPALTGPYGFNLKGGYDAFVAKLRGDAYSNVYSAYFGGSQNDIAQFCTLDPFGNLWIAGRTASTDFPNNPRDNIQFLTGDPQANGGTFVLSYLGRRTTPLPFNATTTQVFNALSAIPALSGGVLKSVTAVRGTQLPGTFQGTIYRIVTDGDLGPAIITPVTEDNVPGNKSVFGLRPHVFTTGTGQFPNPDAFTTRAFVTRTFPKTGSWTLTYTDPIGGPLAAQTTAFLSVAANAATVQAALNALTNLNGGTFKVTGTPFSTGGVFDIQFTPQNSPTPGPAPTLESITQLLGPVPSYTQSKFTDIFVMRWAKSSSKVLDPAGDIVQIFGGEGNELLSGFAVKQNDNPGPNDPVLFGFAGDYTPPFGGAATGIPGVGGTQDNFSFIALSSFSNGVITPNTAATKWVAGTLVTTLGGFAMDRNGDAYICGNVGFDGFNDDNPGSNGEFPTTPGIFENGDKLRYIDTFMRKYDQQGNIVLSGILGGNGDDTIGGIDTDPHGVTDKVGSAIYVDAQNSIYMTGIARSFNFPRTSNVFGETFDANAVVFVTKISADGATIIQSTNLKTTGNIVPSGISVDPSGNTWVAGTAHPNFLDFPQTNGQAPGDPNEPIATAFPTLPIPLPLPTPTTPEPRYPLDYTYSSPAVPEMPTTEGWVFGLNQTFSNWLYMSWTGGLYDEMVFGPYVDKFGDVWVNGWTDSARRYITVSSTGTVKQYGHTGEGLPVQAGQNPYPPQNLISPLAFKATPAAGGDTNMTMVYGAYGDHNGNTWGPGTLTAAYRRDGFVTKLRYTSVASIQAVNLNPSTVPGGLGATSTGTVTLSGPAPGDGAQVEITLDNASASFSPTSPQSSMVLTIAGGQTTGNFTIYTNAVTANTAVNVKATYLGTFQSTRLNVVPWLQGIGVTPNTLVGGNVTSGRISLSAPALVGGGGVVVNLTTDTPSLISFPGGSQVTVPEGLSSVNFTVKTAGVDKKTFANVTASVLGVNRTAAMTLTTANLLNLTFNPQVVAGLSSTTGTLVLDGEAGPNGFDVTLGGAPAGFVINPTTIHFGNAETSHTFTVTTPNVTSNATVRVTANRAASGEYQAGSVSNTFTVVTATIASISIDPSTVNGGDTATLTVNLSAPAPASGVLVNLASSDPATATIASSVTIPAGAQTATVDVPTQVISKTKVVTITASRSATDSKSATLTVTGVDIALSLNPASVSGGQSVTGTVTSARPAGAGGLVVALSSSNTAVANPAVATVTIPAGQTTATFTVNTFSVDANTNVTITASLGAGTTPATAVLEVRSIGVLSVAFNKASVTGGQTVSVTITLDAPAKAGGTSVNISVVNNQFVAIPAAITVPAGQTTYTFTLTTRRVSRDQRTTLIASAAGASAQASLLVKFGF
ncbi:beta strand repeat-containing protein [Fimbriimonas ginsengisoli]|nr:hypothetical protein [Fimbriimonas ginsengisoli]